MNPSIATLVTLTSVVFILAGCTTEQTVSSGELEHGETAISAVMTTDRTSVLFEKVGGQYAILKDSTIIGFVTDGGERKMIRMPVAQVDSADVERPDAGKTVALVFLGIPAGILALGLAFYAIGPRY